MRREKKFLRQSAHVLFLECVGEFETFLDSGLPFQYSSYQFWGKWYFLTAFGVTKFQFTELKLSKNLVVIFSRKNFDIKYFTSQKCKKYLHVRYFFRKKWYFLEILTWSPWHFLGALGVFPLYGLMNLASRRLCFLRHLHSLMIMSAHLKFKPPMPKNSPHTQKNILTLFFMA